MIAAALIAASALVPSGVTATIQADPVCLPVTAMPGHSYPLSVYVSGSSPLSLAVTPAHGSLERTLHQVPSSWVRFAANPAGSGQDALTIVIPGNAAPGAYWSDVEAGTQGQAQAGSGGQAVLGAAATTALVFTVGPSGTPPPPCDALDLAQSTGKFRPGRRRRSRPPRGRRCSPGRSPPRTRTPARPPHPARTPLRRPPARPLPTRHLRRIARQGNPRSPAPTGPAGWS